MILKQYSVQAIKDFDFHSGKSIGVTGSPSG